MTFEQILKSECCDAELRAVCVECLHGEPLKQSFIKYLQAECERLEKSKHKIYDNWATTHDRDDERFTKLTKEEKGHNKVISDQITYITKQIKSTTDNE